MSFDTPNFKTVFIKVLLDTNIILHREAAKIVNEEIRVLFLWLNKLKYLIHIHPVPVKELKRNVFMAEGELVSSGIHTGNTSSFRFLAFKTTSIITAAIVFDCSLEKFYCCKL